MSKRKSSKKRRKNEQVIHNKLKDIRSALKRGGELIKNGTEYRLHDQRFQWNFSEADICKLFQHRKSLLRYLKGGLPLYYDRCSRQYYVRSKDCCILSPSIDGLNYMLTYRD